MLIFILGAVAITALYTIIGHIVVGLIERWNKDAISYDDAGFVVFMWGPALVLGLLLSPIILIMYLCMKFDDLTSFGDGLNKIRRYIRGFK